MAPGDRTDVAMTMPVVNCVGLGDFGPRSKTIPCANLSANVSRSMKWSNILSGHQAELEPEREGSGTSPSLSGPTTETVEYLFQEALNRAKRAAASVGLSDLNAEMIAADAIEDAWLALKESGDFSALPAAAFARAKYLARGESSSRRRFSLLLHGEFSEEGGVHIGQAPEQEEAHSSLTSLGEVQDAMERFEEADRNILLLMLRGYGSIEIAKELGRAVPLIVSDLARIRYELAKHRRPATTT